MPKPLSHEAIDALANSSIIGLAVKLPPKLPRKLYEEVNAALVTLGGTWNRKAQAHLFSKDPGDAIDQVVVDGEFMDRKRDFEQFFTPPELAARVVKLADVAGHRVLEPSAGHGALARECVRQGARSIEMVEKDDACLKVLADTCPEWPGARAPQLAKMNLRGVDFLEWETGATFDRVVSNPPFSRQRDIAHVTRAYGMLAPRGRLVSIMSAGVKWREDSRSQAFRALVDQAHGTIESLPQGSFRSSGTDVHTVLVTMEKAS